MLHIGHLNLLNNAKKLCEKLVVCISTDEYVKKNKKKLPIIPFEDRKELVKALRCVDEVGVQSITFGKKEAVELYSPDVLVVGDDWTPETYSGSKLGVTVIYLPYTKKISSTILREKIAKKKDS